MGRKIDHNWLMLGRARQASGSFFGKNEQKQLLLLPTLATAVPARTVSKSFFVTFFQESYWLLLTLLKPITV
jgi:hypothetical protein